MAVFYGARAAIQSIFKVGKPEGYDWDYPGFFSIYSPYGKTNDFFYSGHCGICYIFFLEFWSVGWYFSSAFAFLVMLLEIFVMIALRSHYTVDIISGMAFAHYFFILSEKCSYLIDWHCLGIPLSKRTAYERFGSSDNQQIIDSYRKQQAKMRANAGEEAT